MPALMLASKTHKPVAGKEVVVEATLTPQSDGATYQLDWGDGSAMETVRAPGRAEHRYMTAKTYTVSASTYVDGSHLYHQILLQVAPVWPACDEGVSVAGWVAVSGLASRKAIVERKLPGGCARCAGDEVVEQGAVCVVEL